MRRKFHLHGRARLGSVNAAICVSLVTYFDRALPVVAAARKTYEFPPIHVFSSQNVRGGSADWIANANAFSLWRSSESINS